MVRVGPLSLPSWVDRPKKYRSGNALAAFLRRAAMDLEMEIINIQTQIETIEDIVRHTAKFDLTPS